VSHAAIIGGQRRATFELEVTETPQRQARTAQMELRFTTVSLKRPRRSRPVRPA